MLGMSVTNIVGSDKISATMVLEKSELREVGAIALAS